MVPWAQRKQVLPSFSARAPGPGDRKLGRRRGRRQRADLCLPTSGSGLSCALLPGQARAWGLLPASAGWLEVGTGGAWSPVHGTRKGSYPNGSLAQGSWCRLRSAHCRRAPAVQSRSLGEPRRQEPPLLPQAAPQVTRALSPPSSPASLSSPACPLHPLQPDLLPEPSEWPAPASAALIAPRPWLRSGKPAG